MRTISDHLGAWIVVGALALAVVTTWGIHAPAQHHGTNVSGEACEHETVAGVVLPQSETWRPNPVLSGISEEERPTFTAYDDAEEQVLARLGRPAVAPLSTVSDYGSSTSRKPTRIC
jgi:hypothetical protein